MLFFLLIALATSFLFWQLADRSAHWFQWGKPDPLSQALQLIQERYVDEIPLDSLRGLNLDSLVSRLDPHSAYLDPSVVKATNEDLAGHFAGIGVGFALIRDTVTVAYPYENSPSQKAGIKTGDQLLAIGDRLLVGSASNPDSVRQLVRGPIGSVARLTIRSDGKVRIVSIQRADIPTPSVSAAYLLDDTTGYIHLTKFSEGSYREAVMAIEKLVARGMRALILDLRSNGGGFLQEAIELADEFLSDDRLIVYTEGAHLKKRSYFCKRPGLFEKGNLRVLMNEQSASASEVLAGALQDWCRATIVGRRSFGKGLVQEQYDLSNQGALRLTVARYYTPLGRCIQRPYPEKRHYHSVSSLRHNTTTSKQFQSVCGDTLYAGGGIEADIQVPLSAARIENPEAERFLSSPEIIIWANRFYTTQKKQIDSVSDLGRLALLPTEKSLQQFVLEQALPTVKTLSTGDWERIGFEIYAQIARIRGGEQEYIRIQNLRDPYLKAIRTTRKSI